MTKRINGLSEIAAEYSGILCDVWGVLHNGRAVYEAAAEALSFYRDQGGRVILLTNSPRPRDKVIEQLNELGVNPGVYDEVVTSGDATRDLIRKVEGPIFHIGPERDLPLFEGLNIELVAETDCAAIVCTGLFDERAQMPEDYRQRFEAHVENNIPLLCANPDIVVHHGDELLWCAGSLANLYAEMGGSTQVAGKPHKPIYDLSMAKFSEITGAQANRKGIIAIGDGMPTDVAGAQNNGFDLLYISAGIHYADYGLIDNPDEAALEKFLASHGATPKVWMPRLIWQGA